MTAETQSSLEELIITHFDKYQTGGHLQEKISTGSSSCDHSYTNNSLIKQTIDNSLQTATAVLKQELTTKIITDAFSQSLLIEDREVENGKNLCFMQKSKEEVENTFINIIDSAFAMAVESPKSSSSPVENTPYFEAISKIFQLLSIAACKEGDGSIAIELLKRARDYSFVDIANVRTLACIFVGLCAKYLNIHETDHVNKKQGKKDLTHEKMRSNRKSSEVPFLMGNWDKEKDNQWREECCALINETLISRLEDKIQAVRYAALDSCTYLFHSSDSLAEIGLKDNILKVMLISLAHDSSGKNRSKALLSIPITKLTTPFILERVKDTNVKVRTDALNILKEKVNVNDLTEKQRVEIIQSGLSERCPETFESTAKMLCCGWMKTTKYDLVALLRLLNPPVNKTACESAARTIITAATSLEEEECLDTETRPSLKNVLKQMSTNEVNAFKNHVLNPVSICQSEGNGTSIDSAKILSLRIMSKLVKESNYFSEATKMEKLSKMIPDVPVLGEILEQHIAQLHEVSKIIEGDDDKQELATESERLEEAEMLEDEECSICLQLLELALNADLKEEGSRRHFVSILHRVLSSVETSSDLIEALVRAMAASHNSDEKFLHTIAEVLEQLNVKESSNQTKDKNDEEIEAHHIRSIEILSVVLDNISPNMTSSPILKQFSKNILPAITNTSFGSLVREAGVNCLGRYAILLDEDTVIDNYKTLLLEIVYNEDEKLSIRAQALLVLTDLSLIFDRILLPVVLSKSGELEISFVDILLSMLSQSKSVLMIISAECASKLLFSGKVHHETLVGHLLMIFFDKNLVKNSDTLSKDEATEVGSSIRLQQLLTIFFPSYCIRSLLGKLTLISSIKPMLGLINDDMCQKVKGRRCTTWPIAKMIEYIINTVEKAEEIESATNISKTVDIDEDELRPISKVSKTKKNSSILSLAEVITSFILQEENLQNAYLRTLCKTLSSFEFDIEVEDQRTLLSLKRNVDELTMLLTDDTALSLLETFHETFNNVMSEDDDEDKIELVNDQCSDSERSEASKDSINSDTSIIQALELSTLNDTRSSRKVSRKVNNEERKDKRVSRNYSSKEENVIPLFSLNVSPSKQNNTSNKKVAKQKQKKVIESFSDDTESGSDFSDNQSSSNEDKENTFSSLLSSSSKSSQKQNELAKIKLTNKRRTRNTKPLSDETDSDSDVSDCYSQESTYSEVEDSLTRGGRSKRKNITPGKQRTPRRPRRLLAEKNI